MAETIGSVWVLVPCLLGMACSGDSRVGLGHEPGSGGGGRVGFDNPQGGAGGGVDVRDGALTVDVRGEGGLKVEVVLLACDGQCAELQAVASGGNAPYHYRWEDGSSDAARTVCPHDGSSTLRVEVHDEGLSTPEFSEPVMTASAEVDARVMNCGGGELCLANPSFEGTPTPAVDTCLLDILPQFVACDCSPDVGPTNLTWRTPVHGASYMAFYGRTADSGESWGTELCRPMVAGEEVPFRLQVAATDLVDPNYGQGWVEIWGGHGPCELTQRLWRSEAIAPGEGWRPECGVLVADAAYTHVTFRAVADDDNNGAYLNVDDFVSGGECATTP